MKKWALEWSSPPTPSWIRSGPDRIPLSMPGSVQGL
jgi:hypothetical protein